MKAIVPDKVNEVMIRRFEMLVHNLQSSFDTYVIHGGFRFRQPQAEARLRGYFSIVFHLLQITGRHAAFLRAPPLRGGLQEYLQARAGSVGGSINPERLLDRTINYGLYFTSVNFSIRARIWPGRF
jgi:hypothetical protein